MPSGAAILSPATMAYRAGSMLAPLLFTQLRVIKILGSSSKKFQKITHLRDVLGR